MVMNVTGSVPITTQDSTPTGLGVGINATVPQVGSRNWEGNGKGKDKNPTGFFDNFWPTLGRGLGEGLSRFASAGLMAAAAFLFG